MSDWLIAHLAQVQGQIVHTLAAGLRSGGTVAVALAFALGALHALTPGHGKAALAAYFLGREAHAGKGVRIALLAALLHVVSGLAVFLVLRFLLKQLPGMFGRSSPSFTALGYAFIIVAGLMMLLQSLRPAHAHEDGGHALTAGIGLLPCPLTISVLGFAWVQGTPFMVGLVLVSLALGIALTIGSVAVAAIFARQRLGLALAAYMPGLERWGRIAQGAAGTLIVVIGAYTVWQLGA